MKRITINTALQKYRNSSPLQIVEEVVIEDTDQILLDDNQVSIDYLLNLIQQLPDRYRLVFNLSVLDGFTHKEIAQLLNISEGTSKSNLSRAKQLLQKELKNHQQKQM